MNRKIIIFFLLTAGICLFSSCPLEEPGFIDQVLQGTILHESYIFVSGYATTNTIDENAWTVYLYNISPEDGINPWEEDAYPGISDSLVIYFTLSKTSSPQTYDINTFGSGDDALMVTGFNNSTLQGSFFDKGTLEITEINLTTLIISGRIVADVNDNSEGSYVNGNFSVPIDPDSV
jgi:hypothetical protein